MTNTRSLFLTSIFVVSAAACSATGDITAPSDDFASVSIALSSVPSGISCGVVSVSVGSDSRTVRFGLGVNRPTTIPLRQLPVGSAVFHADAFEENCESVNAASVPAWSSDDVTRTIRPGHNPDVALTLHPNATGSVSVGFDNTPPDLSGPWWIMDGNMGGDNPTIDPPILPCGPTEFLGWDATIGKPGLDGHVWDLEAVAGGSSLGAGLYACGEFASAGGVTVNKIAKWDGSNWSALGAGLGGGDCTTLEVGPDNRLYVGGTFTSAGALSAHHLASWDGAKWLALPNVDNTPYDLHFHTFTFDDGMGGLHTISDLYIAGDLTSVGGVTVQNDLGRLRALNYTMGLFLGGGEITDDSFGSQAPAVSYRITDFDGDGFDERYVGGTSFQDPIHAGNPDPDRWAFIAFSGDSPFFFHHLGMGNADPSTVFDLVPYKSSLFGMGSFARPNNHESSNIFQFESDFTGVTHGVDDVVRGGAAADVGDGNALYIGGRFTNVDRDAVTHNGASIPALHVARWNGSSWRRLGPGVGPADDQPIEPGNHAHVLRGWDAGDGDGTSLYVAGRFTVAGDLGVSNIARWGCRQPDSTDRVDLGPLTWAPLGDIGPAVSFLIGADGIPTGIECGDQTIPVGPNATVSACGWNIVTGSDADDTIDVRRSLTGTVVFGGPGNDTIEGSSFRDVIFGDGGNDVIDGNDGNDRILGGSGADVIRGGNGDDAIAGGPGDDSLEGGDGFDYFDARQGIDEALDQASGDVVQR